MQKDYFKNSCVPMVGMNEVGKKVSNEEICWYQSPQS